MAAAISSGGMIGNGFELRGTTLRPMAKRLSLEPVFAVNGVGMTRG
jgi:hypothetical protein